MWSRIEVFQALRRFDPRTVLAQGRHRDPEISDPVEDEFTSSLDNGSGTKKKVDGLVCQDATCALGKISASADGASSNPDSQEVSQGIIRTFGLNLEKNFRATGDFFHAVYLSLESEKKRVLRDVKNKNEQLAAAFAVCLLTDEATSTVAHIAHSGDCEAYLLTETNITLKTVPFDHARYLAERTASDKKDADDLRELFEESDANENPYAFFTINFKTKLHPDFWRALVTFHRGTEETAIRSIWNERKTTHGMYSPMEKVPSQFETQSFALPEGATAILLASDGFRKALKKYGATLGDLHKMILTEISKGRTAQEIVDALLEILPSSEDDIAITLTVLPKKSE